MAEETVEVVSITLTIEVGEAVTLTFPPMVAYSSPTGTVYLPKAWGREQVLGALEELYGAEWAAELAKEI